jgi:glyoxylase-like metal-dependent hydrolase (beta-lactamase superfamily II)
MGFTMKTFVSQRMGNISYLLSSSSDEAILVDPDFSGKEVIDHLGRAGLRLLHIVDTHHHIDHVHDNQLVAKATGARIAIHEADSGMLEEPPDIALREGDTVRFGDCALRVMHTPGHTPGGICLVGHGHIFTGDTMFVGGFGRTDMEGGDRRELGKSLRRLADLDPGLKVHPGHIYGPAPSSTIGEERSALRRMGLL